jgi:hypothetical protein
MHANEAPIEDDMNAIAPAQIPQVNMDIDRSISGDTVDIYIDGCTSSACSCNS